MHGWIHERNTLLGHEDELDLTAAPWTPSSELTGTRPTGIRTPSWDFSDPTLDVILELGFVYDSSLMADDEPYVLLADGEPTGLVEIPVDWIRDDAPYFMMDRYASLRPYMPPRVGSGDLDRRVRRARAEGGVVPAHPAPPLIGHRSRWSSCASCSTTSAATTTSGGPPTPRSPTYVAPHQHPGEEDHPHEHTWHPRRTATARRAKLTPEQRKAIVAGSIGNTVEWVDWALYATFAPDLRRSVLRQRGPAVDLLSTLAVFAVGFVMRPSAAPSSVRTPTGTAARRASR